MTTEATTAAIEFPKSLHHATATKARALITMLAAEYPAISIGPRLNEDSSKVLGWVVVHEATKAIVMDTAKVPDLADILDACEADGIDPTEVEEAEDDEPKVSGSVVPETYRQTYRENSSNGQTCGDWLAEWLVTQTHSLTGFMVEDFTAILRKNGVDLNSKWGRLPESGQKGWIGRYRMNGRQVLEKIVAKSGEVIDMTGNTEQVPAEFLATLRAKHSKWLAKEAKVEAAAEAMLREAVEGPAKEA